jgi:hypothetical protein
LASTQFDRVDGVPALPAQASSVRRPTSGALSGGSTSTCSKPCSSVSTKPAGEIGSTTARSADEVALIRDTISHYGPVLIAPLSIRIRRAGVLFGRNRRPSPQCLRLLPLLGKLHQTRSWLNRSPLAANQRCRLCSPGIGPTSTAGFFGSNRKPGSSSQRPLG